MPTRVVLSKEAEEQLALRNRPFLLGMLLAPLGGMVGALVFDWLTSSIGLRREVIMAGLTLGSIFALPVTLILFPLMHRAQAQPFAYPLAGLCAGLVYGALAPAALAGGVVTGLIFAVVNRDRPRNQQASSGTTDPS